MSRAEQAIRTANAAVDVLADADRLLVASTRLRRDVEELTLGERIDKMLQSAAGIPANRGPYTNSVCMGYGCSCCEGARCECNDLDLKFSPPLRFSHAFTDLEDGVTRWEYMAFNAYGHGATHVQANYEAFPDLYADLYQPYDPVPGPTDTFTATTLPHDWIERILDEEERDDASDDESTPVV